MVEIVNVAARNSLCVGGGLGAQGTYNLSDGTLRVSDRKNLRNKFKVGCGGGVGNFNQSGGLADFNTLGVGHNDPNDTNIGHGFYNLTGGTLRSRYKVAVGRTNAAAEIISYGELAVSQSAMIETKISMAFGDKGSGTLRLLINSAGDFDIRSGSFWGSDARLVVSLTDGYKPTIGQRWKFLATQDGQLYDDEKVYQLNTTFTSVTEGFAVEMDLKTASYYLVYTGTAAPSSAPSK